MNGKVEQNSGPGTSMDTLKLLLALLVVSSLPPHPASVSAATRASVKRVKSRFMGVS